MTQTARLAILVVWIALVSGCSILPKSEPVSVERYTLDVQLQPRSITVAQVGHRPVLLLVRPRVRAELDSPRMAYRQRDYDIRYFARNRWADSPADLLMPSMQDALQNSGLFSAVLGTSSPVSADWRLETELLDFSQDFRVQPSQFRLRFYARLVDLDQRRVIGSRYFELQQPAVTETPYGGVQAANQAWERLLHELLAFCAEQLVPAP